MRCVLILTAALMLCLPSGALAGETLYEDLGGQEGVAEITEGLFDRVVKHPRTADSFDRDALEQTKRRFADQLCELTGGGCTYDGLNMADAHLGHDVTEAQMNAMIEMLQASMDDADIPFRTQNRLLAILATFHRDIVTAR